MVAIALYTLKKLDTSNTVPCFGFGPAELSGCLPSEVCLHPTCSQHTYQEVWREGGRKEGEMGGRKGVYFILKTFAAMRQNGGVGASLSRTIRWSISILCTLT